MDADTGLIVTTALTSKDFNNGSQVGPLLDLMTASTASFTANGAYVQKGVVATLAKCHPEALIIARHNPRPRQVKRS